MKIIDGKKISEEILEDLKIKGAPEVFVAAVMVGEDPASLRFVERKKKFSESIGAEFKLFKAGAESTEEDVETMIKYLARDPECGGIMVQLPLPSYMDRKKIFDLIPEDKDVDAMKGSGNVLSPAVLTVEEILKREAINIAEATIAIVGPGFLVGKPAAEWLRPVCKKLIIIDKGDDIRTIKEADVIIVGVGERGLVKIGMLKDDAVVIDFGCSLTDEGKICGDLNIEGIEDTDIRYTPTPGGTGPILIAKLFENFYRLNGKQAEDASISPR